MTPRSMTVDRGPLRLVAAYDGRARSELFVYLGGAETPAAVEHVVLADAAARARVVSVIEAFDSALGPIATQALLELAALVAADRTARGDGAGAADQPGRALALADPEPWPDPVDGAALLDELADVVRRYLVLSPPAADAVAAWVLHAYAHDAARVSPILAISSPTKRCGKTRLLEVMAAIVPRALPTINITPAALYRTVETYSPTLLVDELDAWLEGREELRGVLNAGHTRAAATVIRCVGDDAEPRAFTVWAPKVLAKIGELPDTLADRSIIVHLERRRPDEPVARLRQGRVVTELEPLRRRAARWAMDHLDALRDYDPEPVAGLHDRAQDNWEPLLAVADLAGGPWPDRARGAARALERVRDDDDVRTLLLADALEVFAERGAEVLTTADLIAGLTAEARADHPWATWSRGRPMTPRDLAKLVRPFGVAPGTVKLPLGSTAKGYRRDAFAVARARYGSQSVTPSPFLTRQQLTAPADPSPAPRGDGSPNAVSRCEIRESYGVTDSSPGVGASTEPPPPPVTLSASAPAAGGGPPPAADLREQVLTLAERLGWPTVWLGPWVGAQGEASWRVFAKSASAEHVAAALERLQALERAAEPGLDEEARRAMAEGA